jgi:hypothetical protein
LTINGYQNIGVKFAVFFAAIVIHANQSTASKFRPTFFWGAMYHSPLFYNRVTIKSLPLIPACKFNLFSIVCVLKINTEFWRV